VRAAGRSSETAAECIEAVLATDTPKDKEEEWRQDERELQRKAGLRLVGQFLVNIQSIADFVIGGE